MTALRQYLRAYRLRDPARMVMYRSTPMVERAMNEFLAGRVLDIGCGTKRKKLLAGPQITEYLGADHAESKHGLAEVDIVSSAYEIPVPAESFDGVLCTAVLEHLEEPAAALREAFRLLRPGGHAIYTVPFFWHLHEDPRDFYRYTEYGLRHLFGAAGFEIVRIEAGSGFWITAGSELSYYLTMVSRWPLRWLARCITAANNLVFPWFDRIDLALNPASRRFTWMHLVVARKPAA